METVLIDLFVVPEESRIAFLEQGHKIQEYTKTLPGFVEGFVYESQDSENRFNFLTTAVWKDKETFENAKKAVAMEYQRRGINPQEMIKYLRVERTRALYERSPY